MVTSEQYYDIEGVLSMIVKLISYSQPSDIFMDYDQDDRQHLDNLEKLVAFCARVSNPSNQYNSDTNEKLLKYLIKHQALVTF